MDKNETEQEIENQEEHVVHHRKSKRSTKRNTIIGVVALVLIIAGGLAWLYTGELSTAKEKVFKVLPLPAVIVDMQFVSAKEALTRIELAKQLIDAQGLGDAADPNLTYDQLIETKKVMAVAAKNRLSVSQAKIDEEYDNLVKQYAGGDAAKFQSELDKTYHMSADKFKNEVIKQELLQAELALWFAKQENLNSDAYKLANDLKGKIDGGQSFDEVAKAYNEDEATKDFAGDSGMIPFNDLLPEFRTELENAQVGEVKLLSSRYGLHVLKILEQNNDGPDGTKQIHLQQLFIKVGDFATWLQEQTDNVRVMKLLKFPVKEAPATEMQIQ